MDTLALKKMANEVRKGIVTAVHSAKSGHPGGSLSAADILIRRIRRKQIEIVLCYQRDILHRHYILR